METRRITEYLARDFIKFHDLDIFLNQGYEGTPYEFVFRGDKYEWYGVYEGRDMIAVQVIRRINDEEIYLLSLQKIRGAGHGVFKCVMDYFSGYKLYLDAMYPELQKMYEGLGFKKMGRYKYEIDQRIR